MIISMCAVTRKNLQIIAIQLQMSICRHITSLLKAGPHHGLLPRPTKLEKATAELVEKIIDSKRHPERGFRAALGVLNLKKLYPEDRIEKSCCPGFAL